MNSQLRTAGGVMLLALALLVVVYLVPGAKWAGIAAACGLAAWFVWRGR